MYLLYLSGCFIAFIPLAFRFKNTSALANSKLLLIGYKNLEIDKITDLYLINKTNLNIHVKENCD